MKADSLNMIINYYNDPETGQPHIYNHHVSEDEVMDIILKPGEDRSGREGSRVAIGKTRAGRFLRVAFDLIGKPLMAYKRRMKKWRIDIQKAGMKKG